MKSVHLLEDPENIIPVIRELSSVLSDEEYARDNTPENLQETDQYLQSEESCRLLEDAIDALEGIDLSDPDSVGEGLEEAKGYLWDIE